MALFPGVVMVQDIAALGGVVSQLVAATTTSVQSAVIAPEAAGTLVNVMVTATAPVFVRCGANPTAVSTGADVYLAANVPYRIGVRAGHRIACIVPTGTASVYISTSV